MTCFKIQLASQLIGLTRKSSAFPGRLGLAWTVAPLFITFGGKAQFRSGKRNPYSARRTLKKGGPDKSKMPRYAKVFK